MSEDYESSGSYYADDAKPEGGKANLEVEKFLTKLLKKKVKVVGGFKSKEKYIEVEER